MQELLLGSQSDESTLTVVGAEYSGVIMVTTSPVAGRVYLDSVLRGVAPQTLNVLAGQYEVSFGSVAGYTTPIKQTVNVAAGQTVPIVGTYKKISPIESNWLGYAIIAGGGLLFIVALASRGKGKTDKK